MAEKRKTEQDDPKQSERFLEDARRLGMDESGKPFERAFKTIIHPKKKASPSKK